MKLVKNNYSAGSSDLESYKKDVLLRLRTAKSQKEFVSRLLACVRDLNFSDFDICKARVDPAEKQIHLESLLTSMPKTTIDVYMQEDAHLYDITLDFMVRSSSPVYVSKILQHINNCQFDAFIYDDSRVIYNLMESFGYGDAYVVPVPIDNDSSNKFLISFLAKDRSIDEFRKNAEKVRLQITRLVSVLKELLTKPGFIKTILITDTNNKKPVLKKEDIEILKAYATFAKTAEQVGQALDITPRKVKGRMDKIKAILGAHSPMGTVYLAIKRGYLDINT